MSSNIPENELKYWLALNQAPAIGSARGRKLLNYFPSAGAAWTARLNELIAAGLDPTVADQFVIQRRAIDPDSTLKQLQAKKINVVTIGDAAYPPLLKEIPTPPLLLYYRGQLTYNYPLAIVGSRRPSDYGQRVTEHCSAQLAAAGMTIVSGLAFGVDTIAHQTALATDGMTVAVLGNGLNNIYPTANRRLAERIVESGGALLSEFAPDMPALRHHFPQRNRIIAGLSLGTLVTEAAEKSGALITAHCAAEYNREVFTVPGDITRETSAGTNNLLKIGAQPITDPAEILIALNLIVPTPNEQQTPTSELKDPIEKQLFDLLNSQPIHVDKLAQSARLDISTVNAALSVMELKGLIKCYGNQRYARR